MLILTRRVGEVVMIGNDVTVTVLGVKGNQVRIGVNAPRDVAVHREEIFERIKREEQDGGSQRPAQAGRRPGLVPLNPRAPSGTGSPEPRREAPRLRSDFTPEPRAAILRGSLQTGEMAEWSKARPC